MPNNQYRPIKSDREDGRFMHTDLFLRDWYKRYRPKLEYKSGMTREEFFEWREKVIEKLREILRFPEDVPPQPEPKMLWEEQRDGYRVQKWESFPEPYSVVPFLMLIPDGVDAAHPAPTVMCYPGTWHTKEALCGEPDIYSSRELTFPEYNQMAKEYVKQGYVAVAVEHPGFGELKPYEVNTSADYFTIQMISMGRNYQGHSTFQKKVILDWVKELDFVDSSNIFASGHSLGKYPVMFLGLLCDCVKGIIYNNDVYDTRERLFSSPTSYLWTGCYTHLLPDCEEWFTTVDLLCAYAPKQLLVSEGGVTKDLEKIVDAYATAGDPSAFEYVYHRFYRDPANRKYDGVEVPPDCISLDEYYVWCNVDVNDHYFKKDIAIPWTNKLCGKE